MAARQNYYNEDLTESTSTAAYPNATAKATLTFTPDASSSYYIMWSAAMTISVANATRRCQATLKNTTAATTLNDQTDRPRSANNDWRGRGGIVKEAFGASPASQTYKVEWGNTSGTADTVKIREATLVAIKKEANDHDVDTGSTGQTVSSSTFVDLPTTPATLTFTPPSSGDYLIIATAEGVNTASASADWACQLFDVGTSTVYGEAVKTSQAIAGYGVWAAITKVTLGASSQTFKLRVKSPGGTNCSFRYARIVALRLSDFDNNYYGENRTRTTTVGNTFADKTTVTQTVIASDHLVLATSDLDSSSNSGANRPQWRVTDSGTTKHQVEETVQTATVQDHAYWSMHRAAHSAGSVTWKTQFANAGALETTGIADSAIAVLQLDASGGGTTPVGKTLEVQWSVSGKVTKTVQAQWDVSTTAAKSLQAQWTVTGLATKTLEAQWDVQAIIVADTFTLRRAGGGSGLRGGDALRLDSVAGLTAVGVTLQAQWNVQAAVTKTLAAQWNVSTKATKTFVAQWTVRGTASKALQAQWSISSRATKTLSAQWSIQAAVSKALQGQWSVFALATKALVAQWNVTTLATKALEARWSISSFVTKAVQAQWNVQAVVTKTLVAQWDVDEPVTAVGKTLEAQWAISSKAAKSVEAQWAVQAVATKALAAQWTVSATASKSLQAQWSVSAKASQTLQALWNVSATAAKTVQAQWTVRALATKALAAQWDVRQIVPDSLVAQWAISTKAAKALEAQWSAQAVVSKSLEAQWDVDANGLVAGKTLEAQWTVRAVAGSSVQGVWNVSTKTTKTLEARWAISTVAGKSLVAQWTLRQAVRDDLTALWNVSALAGQSLQGQWAVQALASKSLVGQWTVTTAAGKVLVAQWDVAGATNVRGKATLTITSAGAVLAITSSGAAMAITSAGAALAIKQPGAGLRHYESANATLLVGV